MTYGLPMRRKFSGEELSWAMKQMQALRQLEVKGDGMMLTQAGIARAISIENDLDCQERLTMILFYASLINDGEDDD